MRTSARWRPARRASGASALFSCALLSSVHESTGRCPRAQRCGTANLTSCVFYLRVSSGAPAISFDNVVAPSRSAPCSASRAVTRRVRTGIGIGIGIGRRVFSAFWVPHWLKVDLVFYCKCTLQCFLPATRRCFVGRCTAWHAPFPVALRALLRFFRTPGRGRPISSVRTPDWRLECVQPIRDQNGIRGTPEARGQGPWGPFSVPKSRRQGPNFPSARSEDFRARARI